MKKILSYLMMIVGIVLTVNDYSSAVTYLKGRQVSLNTMSYADFDEKAAAEGDVVIAIGPFCGNNEKKRIFGIPVGKREVRYYFVSSVSPEQIRNALIQRKKIRTKGVWYVAKIEDENTNADISAYMADMTDWFKQLKELLETEDFSNMGEAADKLAEDMPECTVHLNGQLVDMNDSPNFVRIRDDYIAKTQLVSSKLAEKMFVDKSVGLSDVLLFFGGIALIVAAVLLTVIPKSEESNIAI